MPRPLVNSRYQIHHHPMRGRVPGMRMQGCPGCSTPIAGLGEDASKFKLGNLTTLAVLGGLVYLVAKFTGK